MLFEEKPKRIEAEQWSGSNWHQLLAFAEETVGHRAVSTDGKDLWIHNPGAQPVMVKPGEWVVYAPDEFLGLRPISNEALHKHYSPVA